MSGFSRRVETPGPKRKTARKRTERSPKDGKKPRGKKAVRNTQVDPVTRAVQGKEPKTSRETETSRETGTGLDIRDGREG